MNDAKSFDEPRISPIHSIELVAEPGDIDERGHVSNLVYLRWIQDVARSHSLAVGWDDSRYEASGALFVVREHHVTFFASAFVGDRVRVTTWIASWRGASSDRRTRITRPADGNRELARSSTLWVYVDIEKTRPRRIPPELVTAFT